MKRREINVFNISFLDLLSGALGAVIILYVAVPKGKLLEPPPAPPSIDKTEELKAAKDIIAKLEAEVEQLKPRADKMSVLASENDKLKAALQKVTEQAKKIQAKSSTAKVAGEGGFENGFDFKGKNLIFAIDVSGSMSHENRIDEVRAGLKMFITSLSSEYKIDILFFPDAKKNPFRSLWGKLTQVNPKTKREAIRFLNELSPYGSTPTRVTMKHILKNYLDSSDIVLLSDGAPTQFAGDKSFTRPREEKIWEVIRDINYHNQGRVKISTIGVGKDFAEEQNQSNKVIFLKQLAKQNEGFFYSF